MLDRNITTTHPHRSAVFVGLWLLLACADSKSHATHQLEAASHDSDAAPSGWTHERKPPIETSAAQDAGSAAGSLAPKQRALKIALLGDEGVRSDARAVLQLIVDEHADALIHLGDLAYSDADPKGWEAQS